MTLRPFHLAFPVHDLAAARAFYGRVLGCPEGRSSEAWVDFDLFGHQIVAHLDPAARAVAVENAVDGHDVPVPHFGVVLKPADWRALAAETAKLPEVRAASSRLGSASASRRTRASPAARGSNRRCSSATPPVTRWSSRRSPTMR